MNGTYDLDGEYLGKPRYRHREDGSLYIRIGGRAHRGFGISEGREAIRGPWAYFCETSRNQVDVMSDVPDLGVWITHGGFGAKLPPPRVTVFVQAVGTLVGNSGGDVWMICNMREQKATHNTTPEHSV